ncbi:4'-phosphopantetheinyl transferase superfamily protein [Streptomyces sp. NL15-2K]|uniref:4'-phosphopantetheinyl transferase family protein n=1 Tax=Streptomyces sp. NL15-2K TaxID=376149 RepID=UPI000FF91F1C|nr:MULTISPECIES: 4'-phosphopantetheinyl transferase superfamily protein [Actinomycetes]WKX13878.1 4'-phosphopantetheinyl transferase superfamily protein [Kutzneria buriramensis]GCB52020.1 4'-phosphopantetheinyl transferase [Streptomyces sp. NL15-2K]
MTGVQDRPQRQSIQELPSPEPDVVLSLAQLPVTAEEEAGRDRFRVLSDRERQRANRFLRQADRNEYVLAHWLLRLALSTGTSVPPQSWDFTEEQYGRPRIAHRFGDVREFSLSHSAGTCLVAVSTGRRVGVDVERQRGADGPRALLRNCLSPDELTRLAALPDERRQSEFIQLWALKEALAKAMGVGLRLPFADVDFSWRNGRPSLGRSVAVPAPELWTCHCLDAPAGFRAALCVRAAGPTTAVPIRGVRET